MASLSEVVVIVPVYKSELNVLEQISLKRCLEALQNHPIVVIAPEGLPLPPATQHLQVERFAPSFFTGISAYSALLLSRGFYQRFLAYRYMLIYQLDAFVFQDDLLDWCARGYDYVGAPWMGESWPNEEYTRHGLPFWTRSRLFHFLPPLDYRVGNGGFSLRRVRTMYRAVTLLRRTIRAWGDRNEDGFWSVALPECWWWTYRVPSVTDALSFAFELQPSRCFAATGGRLPFGCHAWERYEPEFWLPHFEAAGYSFDLTQVRALCKPERPSKRNKPPVAAQ